MATTVTMKRFTDPPSSARHNTPTRNGLLPSDRSKGKLWFSGPKDLFLKPISPSLKDVSR